MGMLNFCNFLKVVWGTPLSLIMMQCSRHIRRYMIRRILLSLSFHSLIREAELLQSRPIRVKISLRKLMRHPVREVQLFSHYGIICKSFSSPFNFRFTLGTKRSDSQDNHWPAYPPKSFLFFILHMWKSYAVFKEVISCTCVSSS